MKVIKNIRLRNSDRIHLILILNDCPFKLGEIVRRLKAKTSRKAGFKLWQPNYYEHVIRHDRALSRIRQYIINNPHVEQIEFRDFYDNNKSHCKAWLFCSSAIYRRCCLYKQGRYCLINQATTNPIGGWIEKNTEKHYSPVVRWFITTAIPINRENNAWWIRQLQGILGFLWGNYNYKQ